MKSTDPTGLEINNMFSTYKMSQSPWGSKPINYVSGSLMKNSGCAITLIANISAMVNRDNINPAVINSKENSFLTDDSISITWKDAGSNAGLDVVRSEVGNKKAAQELLNTTISSEEKLYVGVYVPITTSGGTYNHWVGVDGEPVVINGKVYLKVSQTSINDTKEQRENNPNWTHDDDGKLYVLKSSVEGTIVATKEKDDIYSSANDYETTVPVPVLPTNQINQNTGTRPDYAYATKPLSINR